LRRTTSIKRPVTLIASIVLAALAAALGVALLGAGEAEAAFPGKNGRISLSIDRNGNEDIYTINPDGTGERRLTTDPDDERNPDWSPGGKKIVFNDVRQFGSGANIQFDTEIFTVNADGSGLRQITNSPGVDGSFRPVFSPNGKKIAFIGDRGDDFDVFVMNADGTGERKVIDADAFSVAFSPDGKKLAYTSFENGSNGDVFSVNLDGSGKTRLTTDPDLDAVADFSPGGGKIAFFSNRNFLSGEIFVMNSDGSDERPLTEGSEASFSPNGKRIVVEVSSGGIAVANATDASNRVNIMPNSLGNENAPDWGAAPKKRR
jgi:TolB protein